MTWKKTYTTWLEKYLKGAEGRTIKKTEVNEEGFPRLILDNGFVLEISQDEEGNGPGFIFGLPDPSDRGKKHD
jgi:hypothetical protein